MQMSPWCAGRTLYHVYVRSFQDSDGDGYGDIPGIINRLDYLGWLGVEGIWLSPCMPSADQDWGYDVSNYRDIHPDLGTLADLDRLVAEAGHRNIRVLLDLVPNHTSSEHPWFVSARESTESPFRDYYVWSPAKPDGAPPTNWIDDIGEPAWTFNEATGDYYMHNFLAAQPDLNWWSDSVQREFDEILDFWFDRGIAGFRIDVANGLYHDKLLRDNPFRDDATIYSTTVQGRYGQEHRYNFNQPEVHDTYRAWRRRADERPERPVLIGETWVARVDELAAYYGDGDELHLCMNFPFLFTPFEAPALAGVVAESLAAFPDGACPVWVGSNHDLSRLATRWGNGDPRRARLAHTVLAALPGTYIVYYGDELGMTDSDIPAALQRDPLTLGGRNEQWPRDNARAPMRWDASASGGFTTGDPWLPVHPDTGCNVTDQQRDPGSFLNLMRTLLLARRSAFGGQVPGYTELSVSQNLWSFTSGSLKVTANFSDNPVAVDLTTIPTVSSDPDRCTEVDRKAMIDEQTLRPWEAVIEQLEQAQ